MTSAREKRGSLALRSPVAGWLRVEKRLPAEGEVQIGTVLARIAAGGPPKVEARAAAGDRARLRGGLAVRFALSGGPGVAGRGVVRGIAPMGDAGGTVAGGGGGTEGTGRPAPGGGRGGMGGRDPQE